VDPKDKDKIISKYCKCDLATVSVIILCYKFLSIYSQAVTFKCYFFWEKKNYIKKYLVLTPAPFCE